MLRIVLGLFLCSLALGAGPLRAQDTPDATPGSPTEGLSEAPPPEGGSSIVPRTNRAIGEAPSPADAWWKLGRMYAERGDHGRAFAIFQQIVGSYRDGSGWVPTGIAAHSHVALGLYYLNGIPGTLPADPDVAYGLLEFAASVFRDADAQFELGRMLLAGPHKNIVQAMRWLHSAAKKSHRPAQALLGSLLVKGGEGIARHPALGLFWLMLANDGDEPPASSVKDLYASALAEATESERERALKYLDEWLREQRQ
jgi:hypothetical protein